MLTIPGTQNVAIPITSNQHDLLQLAALIKEKISLPEEMAEIMQIKEMSLPLAKKLLVTPPERMLKETIEKLLKVNMHSIGTVLINPCPAEPGYILPLQTV